MKILKIMELTEKGKAYLTVSMIDKVMLYKWSGVVLEEAFKRGVDRIGELSTIHKPSGYLAHLLNFSGIEPRSLEYANTITSHYVKTDFAKAYPDQSFRHVMLVTEDLFMTVSAQGGTKRLDKNMEIIFTFNLAEASQLLGLIE